MFSFTALANFVAAHQRLDVTRRHIQKIAQARYRSKSLLRFVPVASADLSEERQYNGADEGKDRAENCVLCSRAKRGHAWRGGFEPDGETYKILVRAGAAKEAAA